MIHAPLTRPMPLLAASGPLKALTTAPSVHAALLKLGSQDSYEGTHRDLLGEIHQAVAPAKETLGRESQAHLNHLNSENPDEVSEALSHLAVDGEVVTTLANQATLKDRLHQTPYQTPRLHTDEVKALVSSLTRTYSGEKPTLMSNTGRLGAMNHSLGVATFAGLPASLPTAILMGAHAAQSGDVDFGLIASLGLALHGTFSFLAGQSGKRQMVEKAKAGPLGPIHLDAYYRQHMTPFSTIGQLENSDLDVVEAIHLASPARGRPPRLSRYAALRVIHDFARVGTIVTKGLQESDDELTYDRLAHLLGLAMLQRMRWQPHILHQERLVELRKKQEEGDRVIILPNHRSHLDIPGISALLRDFRLRLIAKDSLQKAPVLGWQPVHRFTPLRPKEERRKRWLQDGILGGAGHHTVDRNAGVGAMRDMKKWASEMFAAGHAIGIFDEGTRHDTPDRRQEFGLLPYSGGAFTIAADAVKRGERVWIMPLAIYGLGMMLPKELKRCFTEGAMENQPVVMSAVEPIPAHEVLEGVRKPHMASHLRRHTWRRHWQDLIAIQSYMNEHSANGFSGPF